MSMLKNRLAPSSISNASEYFLSRIQKDGLIEGLCNPIVSRDSQEILEAGLLSSLKGKRISLPLPILQKETKT